MKYIVNTSNDPAYNIALEAYAFRELVNEDELFILWINQRMNNSSSFTNSRKA